MEKKSQQILVFGTVYFTVYFKIIFSLKVERGLNTYYKKLQKKKQIIFKE